jgi:hypothetical protein
VKRVSETFRQEGVVDNIYHRLALSVELPDGTMADCMAYQIRPDTREASFLKYGKEKMLPSLRYKNVILLGARENKLPEDYILFLENIKDNGYDGDVDVNIPLTAQD